MNSQRKMRVCVVGAGAAGLCALRHFAANLNEFEIEAFEKMEKIGGTWIYNEKTGFDVKGLPIHSSMYRNLRTNLPCEIMNFPDYRKMKGDKSSTVTHQQVLAYLKDYAKHFQLCQFIQFNTLVEHVQPELIETDKKFTIWKVQVKNLETNQVFQKQFDVIIICAGQYFDPNIPVIAGIITFPGQILHSHSYRKPEEFSEKSIVILGASASGIDIGIELCDKAKQVYLSHYGKRIVSILPSNLTQVAAINKAQYFLALLKGRASLPSKEEMLEDSKCKTEKKRHAHVLGAQQWAYHNNLAQAGGFNPLPPFYQVGYDAWSKLRASNLWHYKDYKLVIADDDKSVEITLQQ
ncbi:flavin-containing monooxygenase FMO GS-OX5-like isoform X2 [Belonocnema kinseyi]|uniref:flavin-containing monooxygenase FMO GS-OX5-like isoform X2 n=1 Tax=Belonocnema kinseyi TaxID=2817044 RepID=UPI00143D5E34|nr:flavin-containing monooxygenase FMO GS-OX5-like isoform X2 [Belonocnema kinseyi]